ncbi:hypothetical protein bcgnr5384_51540 [Bacillus cereus]
MHGDVLARCQRGLRVTPLLLDGNKHMGDTEIMISTLFEIVRHIPK